VLKLQVDEQDFFLKAVVKNIEPLKHAPEKKALTYGML